MRRSVFALHGKLEEARRGRETNCTAKNAISLLCPFSLGDAMLSTAPTDLPQDSVKSQKQYRDFGAGFGERRIAPPLSFKASG